MAKPTVDIDLSYARAATILARIPDRDPISILLVGCGGTGSYMAMHIGRLLYGLTEQGKYVQGFFVDHDRVEPQNIGRQLFCEAELGVNKADVLAMRYGTSWGIGITPVAAKFKTSMLPNLHNGRLNNDGLVIIVGCVDNADARKEISRALNHNDGAQPNDPIASKLVVAPHVWWLDCGNHEESGQVLLGTAVTAKQLANAFPSAKICQALPAPSLQSPDLLKPRREETKAAARMSCAELTAANLQSLNINACIAAEASDFLTRLLVTRNLKRFACEINLAAGSMRSTYATPEAVAAFAGATS